LTSITTREFIARLPDMLERDQNGEDIEVMKDNQMVAVLVQPSRLRRLVRTPNTIAADAMTATLKRVKREY
jgi:antitoxin (DNA-binding transcriptional repressor) of toxin-antitoxin stability system